MNTRNSPGAKPRSQAPEFASDLLTFDDFCAIVKDGEKADLLDGVIDRASPDSRKANRITSFLNSLLEVFIAAREIGGKCLSVASHSSSTKSTVLSRTWHGLQKSGCIWSRKTACRGGPDVAVEAVSRDSRQRDWVDKRHKYESAGVEACWIIDPIQRRVEFLRLIGGRYDIVPLEENLIFRSQAIPGFWLNIEWLPSDPLPNVYRCLQEVLGHE